jgi:hypothetical protein
VGVTATPNALAFVPFPQSSTMLRTLTMPATEVFRSMHVAKGSRTPYTDATQVSRKLYVKQY